MLAHKGTARTAPERHHRLQLPCQRRENRIQNQLCVRETVCGPAGRHHLVRTQPPRQQQLPRHDRRARHAATTGKRARRPTAVGRDVADIDRRPALGMEREKHGADLRAETRRHHPDGRLAQGGHLPHGHRVRDPQTAHLGRGTERLPLRREAPALLPVPKELLLRMRGPCRQLTRLALLGLRAGRIHRGRGGPCSGVAPSRDGA